MNPAASPDDQYRALLVAGFPHCDQAVLHTPGECRYCDAHPDWQALRRAWGIAYTGHQPEPLYEGGPMQAPCPSDYRRGVGAAHTWGGNRPTNIDVPQEETFESKVMYHNPVTPASDCPLAGFHGNPYRYCPSCDWQEPNVA